VFKYNLFSDNPIFAKSKPTTLRVKGDGCQMEIREEGEVGN
jgi:hypothetical protein